ncbi:MAG: hypothetical protein HYT94_00555 [Parcubacteria group bacterium]|nr:hypothetical protein [Parcubacteria group bacterium]
MPQNFLNQKNQILQKSRTEPLEVICGRTHTKKTFTSGFILVETLVAVSLLMLAVPAALTVATKSISIASYSKAQVTATYLAQEGLEIVRYRRDSNMLQMPSDPLVRWRDGFVEAPIAKCNSGRCRVDYGVSPALEPRIERCMGGCSIVLYKNTNGTYAHTSGAGWEVTPYSRYVEARPIPGNPNEVRITSVVTYSIYGITKTITLSENLTKWIQ